MVELLTWTEEREVNRRSQQLEARNNLASYLESYDWDYFITVTTKKPWKDGIKLNSEVYSQLNNITAVERAFICTEPHYIRSGVHAHGIVKVDEKYKEFIPAKRVWNSLFHRFGRSSVDLVRSQHDTSMYCSKYVLKSTGDYYFWGRGVYW